MSISKRWIAEKGNVESTLNLYRSLEFLTIAQVASRLETTPHTVQWILKHHMSTAEFKALSAIRYQKSKMAEKNPMFGKTGDQHHNWIGLVDDGYGYLTCLKDGKRQFVHRIVMAEALGMKELPSKWDVHHIDDDKKHNHLDNLALVTKAGHRGIHKFMKDSLSVILRKLKVQDALKYLTSQ